MRGEKIVLDTGKIKLECLNSAYCDLANLLGVEAVMKIHAEYRGQQIFFPMELYSKDFIKQQIISEYNGNNVKQLATKYGYTEKWVRKLLKDNIIKSD